MTFYTLCLDLPSEVKSCLLNASDRVIWRRIELSHKENLCKQASQVKCESVFNKENIVPLMDEPLFDRRHLVEAVGQLRGLVGGVDVDQHQASLGRGELRGVPGDRVNTSLHQLHCTVLYCTVLFCTVLCYHSCVLGPHTPTRSPGTSPSSRKPAANLRSHQHD